MTQQGPRRVVVTGLGAVTSIGIGAERFWASLLEARSGISPIRSFDASAFRVRNGGEVHDFRAEEHLPSGTPPPRGRAARMAVESPYPNPRKVEYAPVLALLREAYEGRRPA